ncbi:MAG: c-type cytochrome [Bryobacterales bacterium]|nr:c-type cytochrome [Bryobacterales bacterium]
MIVLALALLSQGIAQEADLMLGAKVFAQSCAVGYCHGSAGAANRGPRLAGRGFDRGFVDKVIRDGVPGTAMPGFKTMRPPELNSVIAYVMKISGGGNVSAAPLHVPSPEPPVFAGPPAAQMGKLLFFDAARGTRCGTCHALEDWGVAVGPNVTGRATAGLRQRASANVKSVAVGAARFPALIVDRKNNTVTLYDVAGAPPVLRTFAAAEIRVGEAAGWTHAAVTRTYTDADLASIQAYLEWLAQR